MDFSAIDTTTRIILFASIFAATAISTAWSLTVIGNDSSSQQKAALGGALATIPAAVAAPIATDGLFTGLALLAFAGLALSLTAVVLMALNSCAGSEPVYVPAAIVPAYEPAPAPMPAPVQPAPIFEAASSTRVATFESLTRVGSPAIDSPDVSSTMLHGASFKPVNRIAFLAEQTGDGTTHRLGDDTHIGRGAGSSIVVDDSEVSREHVRVRFENGRFVLYDLGGTNGTVLKRDGRSRKVTTPTILNDRDVLVLGRTRLAFFEVAP